MIKHIPIVSVCLALLAGIFVSMMLGGIGPWAAELSVRSIGGAIAAAIVVSWIGAVFIQTRWLPPMLFSLALALGLFAACLSRHWGRCIALIACIVVSFLVVAFFGFDRRKIENRGG
jgi:hypothetical protein